MATIAAIRSGLKTRLETISGLRVSTTVPAAVNIPQAFVGNVRRTYHETFGTPGDSHLMVDVVVLAGTSKDIERAQVALDLYCEPSGASSVVGAIEGDQTLGSIVDACEVKEVDQGLMEFNGLPYVGATFVLEVYT